MFEYSLRTLSYFIYGVVFCIISELNEKKTRKHNEMKTFIEHFFIAIFVRLL